MHMRLHPQIQATQHVANFVCENDSPEGLLIVYYAGHGWAEDESVGRLSLSGRFPVAPNEKDMSIEWTEVEHTLGKTQSDVLVIFDCCHAGLLCRPATRGRQSFYYVAACKEDQRTRSAGEKSFTTAMIWALQRLSNRPGFTVTTLISTLMEHDKFPRDEQEAVVYPSRFGHGPEPWIAPTQKDQVQVTPLPTHEYHLKSKVEDVKPTANILDLRFHFSEHAPEAHIEETAKALKDLLASRQALHFHRITFIDHTSYVEWSARQWLNNYRRRASARNSAASSDRQSALENSKAAAASFDNRLLRLPGLQTGSSTPGSAMSVTAVASPASALIAGEKDGLDNLPGLTSDQSLTLADISFCFVAGCVTFLGVLGGGLSS